MKGNGDGVIIKETVRYISLAYPVRIKSARNFSGVSMAIRTPDCTT